jgi:hypothetical protein
MEVIMDNYYIAPLGPEECKYFIGPFTVVGPIDPFSLDITATAPSMAIEFRQLNYDLLRLYHLVRSIPI